MDYLDELDYIGGDCHSLEEESTAAVAARTNGQNNPIIRVSSTWRLELMLFSLRAYSRSKFP